MKRPMVSVRDPVTLKRITREMNDEEFAQWEIDQAAAVEEEKRLKDEEKDKKEKSKKITKKLSELIDLTEDEIAELLGLQI
jgi:hypothetical protein